MHQVLDGVYHLKFEVSFDHLSDVRARLTMLIERLTPNKDVRHHVLLAIEEVLQNVIRHEYRPEELPGHVELRAWREPNDLVLEIRDHARPVDLSSIRPRPWDPSRPGGLGLRLIQATMDDVHFSHAPDGDGNIVRMRKHLV